jgi:thiol-disulfide isomerase/thioredoxin
MFIQYFGAQWCKPCQEVKPFVIELCKKHGFDLKLFDYDEMTDEEKETISKLPTIRICEGESRLCEITKNHKQTLEDWIVENVRVIPNEDF